MWYLCPVIKLSSLRVPAIFVIAVVIVIIIIITIIINFDRLVGLEVSTSDY